MTYQEIAEAVDKIIDEIGPEDRRNMGAINWGDLSVHEIRECRSVWPDPPDAKPEIEVSIEEADPSNYEFLNHIYERMLAEHGVSLSIVCEW